MTYRSQVLHVPYSEDSVTFAHVAIESHFISLRNVEPCSSNVFVYTLRCVKSRQRHASSRSSFPFTTRTTDAGLVSDGGVRDVESIRGQNSWNGQRCSHGVQDNWFDGAEPLIFALIFAIDREFESRSSLLFEIRVQREHWFENSKSENLRRKSRQCTLRKGGKWAELDHLFLFSSVWNVPDRSGLVKLPNFE